MRRRTIRYTQEELTRIALADAHEFQKVSMLKLIEKGWAVKLVSPSPKGNRMVILRHTHDPRVGAAVYPDGSFARQTGTVKWDWGRCERAAEATIPDPFVADILAGKTVAV